MLENSKKKYVRSPLSILFTLLIICGVLGCTSRKEDTGTTNSASGKNSPPAELSLLNVSYDPTREFYQDFNIAFAEEWKKQTGQVVHFEQSHGGSGKQARAVMDGLEADVVTLALANDTFLQRGIGDALICWENEAHLALDELGKDQAELVVPSISILAEPPVAIVDNNVDRHSTREVAEAYLKYLYSSQGQTIAARRYYRPVQTELVASELLTRFPTLELFTIDDVFGGWERAQADHFNDGATFDQIYILQK